MDREKLQVSLEKAFRETEIFKPEAASWITEIISYNYDKMSYTHFERLIRSEGNPLSKEEKKALGISPNAHMGHKYLEALTDKGKKDPMNATVVIHRIFISLIRDETSQIIIDKARSLGLEITTRICPANDDRTCEQAKKLKDKKFPYDSTPSLPLSECDAEVCRCVYLFDFKKLDTVKENFGETAALRLAALGGYTETLQALNAKEKKNIFTNVVLTALGDFTKNVQAFIDNGNDVNAKDNNGITALMAVAVTGFTKTVQALLDNGADVNAKDNNGITALIAAAHNGHTEIVQALLDNGADVNAKNNEGITALIIAAYNGHIEIVQALLDNGADLNAKDNKDQTALMFAIFKDNTEIVNLLKKYRDKDKVDSLISKMEKINQKVASLKEEEKKINDQIKKLE